MKWLLPKYFAEVLVLIRHIHFLFLFSSLRIKILRSKAEQIKNSLCHFFIIMWKGKHDDIKDKVHIRRPMFGSLLTLVKLLLELRGFLLSGV